MLDRLKSVFQSDAFVPTSAIFPTIDSERIAKDLRLEEQGATRGSENQPPTEAKDFDHIETGIIERVEELRRKGLENFETNRRVYNERLARAGSATKEVEVAAGMAKGEFGRQVQVWHSAIEGPRERLADTYRWRARYRTTNWLERPAKEFEGWTKVFSLAIILIVLEAGMNSYLFSQGNEFGLLGGLLAAAIVSVVDLPPGRPSFITRVLGVDSGRFRVGQARRARSPGLAQAPGAPLPGSGFLTRNAA